MVVEKHFVIIKSGGGELTNQLWNYISVYAFALSCGASVSNPSFFEYHRYFNLIQDESFVARFFSFWFQGKKIRRRGHWINQFWRRIYSVYAQTMLASHQKATCSSENNTSSVTYLPPTASTVPCATNQTVYFNGWLFRNPEGLTQYRDQIIKAFSPAPQGANRIDEVWNEIKKDSKKIIGLHYRQGDYAYFKGGKYLLSATRMREVLDEYCEHHGLSKESVRIFIASDGPVDLSFFSEYEIYRSKENAVADLFLLSRCTVIIGSDSSFGHFASWYGNIPHVVAKKEPIDWEYYNDKTAYFPNKYCTLAQL